MHLNDVNKSISYIIIILTYQQVHLLSKLRNDITSSLLSPSDVSEAGLLGMAGCHGTVSMAMWDYCHYYDYYGLWTWHCSSMRLHHTFSHPFTFISLLQINIYQSERPNAWLAVIIPAAAGRDGQEGFCPSGVSESKRQRIHRVS